MTSRPVLPLGSLDNGGHVGHSGAVQSSRERWRSAPVRPGVFAAGVLCVVAIGCSANSDVEAPMDSNTAIVPAPTEHASAAPSAEPSGSQQPCGSEAIAVAVRFAAAVQASDVDAYSACESATTPPAHARIVTLATFGTLVFEDAFEKGGGVDIPAPPIPNGDLPPQQCGVNIVGTHEANGWYVTDITFYCSV